MPSNAGCSSKALSAVIQGLKIHSGCNSHDLHDSVSDELVERSRQYKLGLVMHDEIFASGSVNAQKKR